MNKKFIAAALAVVMFCSLAGIGTMAWFTNSATSTANEFQSGTLKIGNFNEATNRYEFDSLEFNNIEPGTKIYEKSTTIENSGSLPLKLVRLYASDLQRSASGAAAAYNDLANFLDLKVYIQRNATATEELVYWGKLSQIMLAPDEVIDPNRETGGGFFDPVYPIGKDDTAIMTVELSVDPSLPNSKSAGSNGTFSYQGANISCDLQLYAAQVEQPELGEPIGTEVALGDSICVYPNRPEFSVVGKDNGDEITYTWAWDGMINDQENMVLKFKHETGSESGLILERKSNTWTKTEVVGNGEMPNFNSANLSVNWERHTITIDKAAFPATWDGFEVIFCGSPDGVGGTYNTPFIPYMYWSLNR